ncbi:MAG: archaeal proteasome endopeptidase complex subunit alpha [Sulfolobales archaeon]
MAFGPPALGYDRAITVFSPDGKLYQVEYASENIRKGWTTIAMKTSKGGVIVAEKRKIAPLIDMKSVEKVYIIDTHIGASFAGLAADGRVLIDYARQVAMNYRFIYDEQIDVELLTRYVCDIKQLYTQHAGVRPFGVSLIFLGTDRRGVRLFRTEINGYYFGYQALAVGMGEQVATQYLEKNYDERMDIKEQIALALRALRASSEGPLDPYYVEIGYVDLKEAVFKKLALEEIQSAISEAGVDR